MSKLSEEQIEEGLGLADKRKDGPLLSNRNRKAAEYVVFAHEHLPEALREIQELRKENERLRDAVRQFVSVIQVSDQMTGSKTEFRPGMQEIVDGCFGNKALSGEGSDE